MSLEDISYFSRTTTATPTTGGVLVEGCALQRATEKEDAPLVGGLARKQTTVWHLMASKLDDAGVTTCKAGDVLLDARGVRWTVLKEQLQTWKTRWRLTCVREN